MQKKILYAIIIAAICIIGFGAYYGRQTVKPLAFDPLNATYMIDGKPVTLMHGASETQAAPGSAAKVTTMVFGQPAYGELNDDDRADAALLIVQDTGGSGRFYYVAAMINDHDSTKGTNALFLGDRIAPQTMDIKNEQIVVNYADRKPTDPMSAQPSIGVSKYFIFDGSTLKESVRVAGPGERCGGNMTTAPVCVKGYRCAPEPGSYLPFGDVGGICAPVPAN